MFPQLRVSTGYTFREAFGKIDDVISRLKEIECKTAAIVDSNTWGHVRFAKATKKAGIVPMFGTEIGIKNPDENVTHVAKSWVLAKDTRKFYNASSFAAQNKGMTVEELFEADGLIRFTGGNLDLEFGAYAAFDYIDINPSSYLMSSKAIKLHEKTGIPLVLTGRNTMPRPSDKNHALAWEVRESVGMTHIATVGEMWDAMKLVISRDNFEKAFENTCEIASRLQNVLLQKAPIISVEGDLLELCRQGQAARITRGHIKEWTAVYEDRLMEEVAQIRTKAFDSYFLVVSDLIAYAKKHMLVGPARGSSAGSLVCYLMGITEVDPIPFGLIFSRFIDISREDFPDIDIDFSDVKRYMVFDYLREKYGTDNVSKLGNLSTLKPASIMPQVGKKFGLTDNEAYMVKNAVIEHAQGDERFGKSMYDTFEFTGPGQEFKEKFPEAADCMGAIEIHPSHTSVHAGGILICNEPIIDFCTVNEEGIPQIDKKDAEELNLLKIDALGLRTLGIIEDSGVITAEELYSLPLNDQSVLDILNDDKVTGIFQIEGAAARGVTRQVKVDRFSKIDNITALARPGPMSSGMVQKYIDRAAGREKVTYEIPQLEPILKDTYGVLIYQEQLMQIVKDLGGFDWGKVSQVRRAMAKSAGSEVIEKMLPEFLEGTRKLGIQDEKASKIWGDLAKFGAYGFNKSHSVSYSIVTYWTCYLKKYFGIDFAAACLREAKDDEQTIAILRELKKEGIFHVAIDPDLSEVNWKASGGKLLGGIRNAKGYGPVKAATYVEKRAAGLLTEKDKQRLAKSEINFADLSEAHTLWGDYYKNPRLIGVTSGEKIINIAKAKDRDEALIICKLVKKQIKDENSPDRTKKRGGKPFKGQSEFLDLSMVDDSVDSPMSFRIKPELYEDFGRKIGADSKKGEWFLIRGWKIPNFSMFIVKKIKSLKKEIENVET